MTFREYQYVGPDEILAIAKSQPAGTRIDSVEQLSHWLNTSATDRTTHGYWIATFTVNVDQYVYLAPRRTEHAGCAAGGPVFSAGEITIDDAMVVVEISNQSTGYCPEPESWNAVCNALDCAGISHPGRFTTEVIFRRCPECGQRNIVKDDWFYCGICDAKLPAIWNFSSDRERQS